MARPIWKGNISFGLVSIPVTVFSAENPSELHFHLLDSRNKSRIRYERVNEETGKEVPWDKIVKAYEFEKGNYVIVNEKELEKVAYQNFQSIDIDNFVDKDELDPIYFEKPYYLEPSKQSEKGYVVLRDTLEKLNKVGIAKVVIKTRQHLAAIFPYKNRLVMDILRFHSELKDPKSIEAPEEGTKRYQITANEMKMAEKLVNAMSGKWDPKKYHDKNRELLKEWIENQIQHKKTIINQPEKRKTETKGVKAGAKSAKIVDFMTLLKKSVEDKEKHGKPQKHDKSVKTSSQLRKRKSTSQIKKRNTPIKPHSPKARGKRA